jgi:acyl-CoA thioesterase
MTTFDQTTSPRFDPGDPDHVRVSLVDAWSSLLGVHGGYVTALTVRAVSPRLGAQRARTVSTSFLRPVTVGDGLLTISTLRAGRSLSTFDVALHQNGRQVTSTRITAAVPADGVEWDHAKPLPVPSPPDCIVVPGPPGIRHLDHGEGRLDPAHLPLTRSEEALLQGHIRPSEPRPIDGAWLVMVLDYFPPAAWTKVDPPTGGVSVDYTVHLHRTLPHPLAPDEWLAVSFRADISADGLSLEHGAIAAPDGRLLAESFHTRWTG